VGQDIIIWPLAKIISPEAISIGNSIIIDDFVFFLARYASDHLYIYLLLPHYMERMEYS